MRRPILTLFLLLCWLGLAVPAQAAFKLTPQSSGATLNGAIDLLEDPDQRLVLEPAQAGPKVVVAGRANEDVVRSRGEQDQRGIRDAGHRLNEPGRTKHVRADVPGG